MDHTYDILVLGGGAAGFFTAINAAGNAPSLRIAIVERGKEVLGKVRISGGGRCNVTHGEFVPSTLASCYPRGNKELLGPFHRFMTGDTMEWFEKRGVPLKTENDGRVFPKSNTSSTIVDLFLSEASRLGVEIIRQEPVRQIVKGDDHWQVITKNLMLKSRKLVVATGSNKAVWKILEGLGHTIVSPVPSLFTFNIQDSRITDLAGIAVNSELRVLDKKGREIMDSQGPLLITHWGMSGPAILKLSAWGARLLAEVNYKFSLRVNWVDGATAGQVMETLEGAKFGQARKLVAGTALFELPKRLWRSLVKASGISPQTTWAELSKRAMMRLVNELTLAEFLVDGKSTFKDEFVTAGGVSLREVNFKTFESKLHRGLYLAGEVLDIDAITGGYNFQNAWTGGYLVASAITKTDRS